MINKAGVPKTAFIIPFSNNFKRMSFDACHKLMDNILHPVLGKYALVYLGDLIVVSNSFKKHVKRLKRSIHVAKTSGPNSKARKWPIRAKVITSNLNLCQYLLAWTRFESDFDSSSLNAYFVWGIVGIYKSSG